jgi:hypothetical protein
MLAAQASERDKRKQQFDEAVRSVKRAKFDVTNTNTIVVDEDIPGMQLDLFFYSVLLTLRFGD